MDVYGGGIGHRALRLRTHLGGLLEEAGLPHRDLGLGSDLVAAWGDGTGEAVHVDTPEVEVVFDGYLNHHGHPTLAGFLPELARRVIRRGRLLEGRESGVFNVVVLDKASGDLHLANDPSGLLPLLHHRTDDGVAFASHLYLMARALELAPDPVGVASKVALGYTLGGRTVFQGVERLNPGELVTYRAGGRTVDRTSSESYFTDLVEPGPDLTDRLWDALVESARPTVEQRRSVGVMLSEGFDSRLVAGVLRHLGADLRTFTHATRGTKGTKIVGDLAERLGARHTFDHLEQGFPADLAELRGQLLLADNLHVPYWGAGSRHLQAEDVGAVTTGYALDTTLGGHAFTSSRGSSGARVLRRYQEMVRQDLGRVDDAQLDAVADDLLAESLRGGTTWMAERVERFLAPELAHEVLPHVPTVVEEMAAEHQRLRDAGSERSSQVIQRYFLENRVRKYSFGQELTLRVHRPLVVPSFEPTFMRLMGSVPPRFRVHHKAYLKLLRDHLPDLARIPSGAHALPATYPRLVLETSRFVWKAHETRVLERFLESKGRQDVDQLRMVLFTEKSARLTPRLPMENLLERASVPVNREKMQVTIDKVRNYEARVFLPPTYLGLELTEIYDAL